MRPTIWSIGNVSLHCERWHHAAPKLAVLRQCRLRVPSLAPITVRNRAEPTVNNADWPVLHCVPVPGQILTWRVDQFLGLTTELSTMPYENTQG
jgi:hypothetical protein